MQALGPDLQFKGNAGNKRTISQIHNEDILQENCPGLFKKSTCWGKKVCGAVRGYCRLRVTKKVKSMQCVNLLSNPDLEKGSYQRHFWENR